MSDETPAPTPVDGGGHRAEAGITDAGADQAGAGFDIVEAADRGRVDSSRPSGALVGFENLEAPAPVAADPPAPARWLAFLGVLIGGLLGALVGYGVADVMYPDSVLSAVGALIGGLIGAAGLGVLVNLTLRAMNEWNSVAHPEAGPATGPGDSGPRVGSS